MNYFGDEWGAEQAGWGMDKPVQRGIDKPIQRAMDKPIQRAMDKPIQRSMDKPVQTPVEPTQQAPKQAPIGHEKPTQPKQAPIGHEKPTVTQPTPQIVKMKQVAAPKKEAARFDPPQQASKPSNSTGFNYFDGDDDWGDSDLTGAMSSSYTNMLPDKTQQNNLPPQQTEQKTEAKEEVVVVVATKEEEKREVVKPAEPRAPKPPAQAETSELSRANIRVGGMGSSVGEWGKKNIQNLAKAPSKRRNNRRNEKAPRKAMNPQPVAPVALSTTPVGSAPSKHQVTTDPSSVSQDDLVQSLMDKVRALEVKVEELENRQIHQLGGVCTLNSTGKVNNELQMVWDSTNHIIRPQKGLKLIEPEKVFLEVSHRGLYQITFTTCGANPQLIINGHVYAAAKSAPSTSTRDSRTSPSTCCVNIYLYLDEKATIAGKVTEEIASENPCEHWLCVRLVHQGF